MSFDLGNLKRNRISYGWSIWYNIIPNYPHILRKTYWVQDDLSLSWKVIKLIDCICIDLSSDWARQAIGITTTGDTRGVAGPTNPQSPPDGRSVLWDWTRVVLPPSIASTTRARNVAVATMTRLYIMRCVVVWARLSNHVITPLL